MEEFATHIFTWVDWVFFVGFFMCGWVAGEFKGRLFEATGVYKRKEEAREAKIEAKRKKKK